MVAKGNSVAKTALLVEDDPPLRKLVHGYLKLLKFEVTEVPDGRRAMGALRRVRRARRQPSGCRS